MGIENILVLTGPNCVILGENNIGNSIHRAVENSHQQGEGDCGADFAATGETRR